ncbi:MAG: ADP-ribose pyrophosphatase [Phycisphaerae bacterium]|nr:MAG: ADP-ribose pyrophosphatase [Phycisphaerae bacterium]
MLGDTNIVPTVTRRLLHAGAKFDFEALTVTDPSGRSITRECVRHPGAVVVVPVLGSRIDPRIVLIQNWRASVETTLWELPAGTLEPHEEPAACAARELIEETGFQAATLTPLGRFHTSPGLSDELMWAFSATGLTPVGQHLEADERITVHPTPIGRVFEMIRQGILMDAKSMLALFMARDAGVLHA